MRAAGERVTGVVSVEQLGRETYIRYIEELEGPPAPYTVCLRGNLVPYLAVEISGMAFNRGQQPRPAGAVCDVTDTPYYSPR